MCLPAVAECALANHAMFSHNSKPRQPLLRNNFMRSPRVFYPLDMQKTLKEKKENTRERMQLTVRDVSKLFNVSEKTIYRWVTQEVLPAYRVNDQYRFNRAE